MRNLVIFLFLVLIVGGPITLAIVMLGMGVGVDWLIHDIAANPWPVIVGAAIGLVLFGPKLFKREGR